MFSLQGGRVGEYLWEKEMERLDNYKDRPWELQSREAATHPLRILIIFNVTIVAALLAILLF